MYPLYCLGLALLIISELFLFVELIRLYPQAMLIWLHRYGQTFFEIILFTLVLSIISILGMKQAIKYARGLKALMQTDPTQLPPGKMSELIEISTPPWLECVYKEDLPDDILETFQDHFYPEAPWMEKLAAFLKERVTTPVFPSITVSLRESVTISVIGPNGKCELIKVSQEQTAAIIAFLAIRGKGAWVRRQDIIKSIYGSNDSNVTKHISRLNNSLNVAIQKLDVKMRNPTTERLADSQSNKLKLIEYEESGKENLWRLLTSCNIEILPELETLYNQIVTSKKDSTVLPPSREMLNLGCHRIIESYGNGLFASYQKRHPEYYWRWATEQYTTHRDHCLSVLEYAAKREWKYAMTNQNMTDIVHQSIRQSAQLCSWRLKVALGIIPHQVHAEKAVRMGLKLYELIGDLVSAQAIFRYYATYMRNQDEDWEPPTEITSIWPEATSLPEAFLSQ
jgi:hypothetical protein